MEIKLDSEIKDVVPYCNKGCNGYFEVNRQEKITERGNMPH